MPALFEQPKAVIGMLHVGALPGTPRNAEPLAAIIARAREEAGVYTRAGVDGLMIENMHDVPYLKGEVGPEITAGMTAVGLAVREECASGARRDSRTSVEGIHAPAEGTGSKLPAGGEKGFSHQHQGQGARKDSRTSVNGSKLPPAPKPGRKTTTAPLPLGVQILAAANREALAVALAVGAAFVRVENFAYAHVADEGLMPVAQAGPLLRYRRQIGADHVKILADVKKKHSSHALTADVSLAEAARTTEFFGADAIVVTGAATGQPASPEDVTTVKNAVTIPVCIGSGVTAENLPVFWPHADIFIVGSYFKRDGVWSKAVDESRVAKFMAVAASLRERGG
jgi:membrane complex biogenesis BtpA family protein